MPTTPDNVAAARLATREQVSELPESLARSTFTALVLDVQARTRSGGRVVPGIARDVVAATGWL